jgi:hypothetical protein
MSNILETIYVSADESFRLADILGEIRLGISVDDVRVSITPDYADSYGGPVCVGYELTLYTG